MRCLETSPTLDTEYLLLLRHLAAAQRRATALADDLAALQRQHQAEAARWRATLADRDALIARLGAGAGALAPPTLAQRLAACWRRLEARGAAPDPVHAAADLVICQTGCIGHGLPWQRGEQCARTGAACTLAVAAPAQRPTLGWPASAHDSGAARAPESAPPP